MLDGIMLGWSEGRKAFPDTPRMYTLILPGRLLSQDIMLKTPHIYEGETGAYNCLSDCCVARLDFDFLRELYENDWAFARNVHESAVLLMYDMSKYLGILRARGSYCKVEMLLDLLIGWKITLSNNALAEVLGCDRTTISREMARIQKQRPELSKAYKSNKSRKISVLDP